MPARAERPGSPHVSERPKVLVIDGNLLTAEVVVLALTRFQFSARFAVPLTSTHLRDLVTWRPTLVLLDVDSVDSTTCLDCVKLMGDAEVPVVLMAGRFDALLVGECLSAGAVSVADKSGTLDDLVCMVARVLAGDVVLGEDAKQRIIGPAQQGARARKEQLMPFDVLTRREKCVLAELMEGHSAESIALQASVSISTVRSQIKAILQKLGVNSQLAAIALARRAGWTLDPVSGEGRLASAVHGDIVVRRATAV